MRARVWMIVLCGLISSSAMATPIAWSDGDDYGPQNSATHQAEKANRTTMPWCPARFTARPVDRRPAQDRDRKSFEHDFAVMGRRRRAPVRAPGRSDMGEGRDHARPALDERGRELRRSRPRKRSAEKIASNKLDRSPAGLDKAEQQKLAFTESDFTVVKPEPGVDPGEDHGQRPRGVTRPGSSRSPTTLEEQPARSLGQFDLRDPRHPSRARSTSASDRPTRHGSRAAGYILQKWMNWTHLPQADAETSLRARIQIAKFAAPARTELCKTLESSTPRLAR